MIGDCILCSQWVLRGDCAITCCVGERKHVSVNVAYQWEKRYILTNVVTGCQYFLFILTILDAINLCRINLV